MSQYKRRNTKAKRRRQEATIVGDLFRILFAVSMLVVAILLAFFVLKNLTGFSLPDLKQSLSSTESSVESTAVSSTAAAQTQSQTTGAVTTVDQTTEEEGLEEETEESSETEEASSSNEVIQEDSDPELTEEAETETPATVAHTETVSPETTERQVITETDAIYESPVIQSDSASNSLGPGFDIEIGDGPVMGGNS